MRYLGLLAIAALCTAGPALADAPVVDKPGAVLKVPPAPKIPQSVWRLGEDRAAEHLQTGLRCPSQVYAYRLNSLHIYDRFGLDVSCGYGDRNRQLTVYLTRDPSFDLAAGYASSKAAVLKNSPQLHPTLLSEDRVADGPLNWMRATFAEDGGLHSSLWLTTLQPGWVFEYRATYPADAEGSVNAALSRIGELAQASAGQRLKLCAMSPAPARAGVLVTDKAALEKLATTTMILGGAAQVAAKDKTAAETRPRVWCAEAPAAQGAIPMLLWRAVEADGSDARMDRVTALTMGPAPELDIAVDALANLVDPGAASEAPRPVRWTVTIHQGEQTWIFGYYDGRPSPEATAELFANVLLGKTKPLGGYSASGHNVTITMPSLAKP